MTLAWSLLGLNTIWEDFEEIHLDYNEYSLRWDPTAEKLMRLQLHWDCNRKTIDHGWKTEIKIPIAKLRCQLTNIKGKQTDAHFVISLVILDVLWKLSSGEEYVAESWEVHGGIQAGCP